MDRDDYGKSTFNLIAPELHILKNYCFVQGRSTKICQP